MNEGPHGTMGTARARCLNKQDLARCSQWQLEHTSQEDLDTQQLEASMPQKRDFDCSAVPGDSSPMGSPAEN